MNRPRAHKHQTPKTLFQRLTAKLCPLSFIRGSESHAKLQHTDSIPLDLEKIVSSISHHSPQNAFKDQPPKTLLD
jgi:hypothetical protein